MTDEAFQKRQEALDEIRQNALVVIAISYGETSDTMHVHAVVNQERMADKPTEGKDLSDLEFFTYLAGGAATMIHNNSTEMAAYGYALAAADMGESPSKMVN